MKDRIEYENHRRGKMGSKKKENCKWELKKKRQEKDSLWQQFPTMSESQKIAFVLFCCQNICVYEMN